MSSHPSSYQPKPGVERWLDERLPLMRLAHDQASTFPTPRNLNYWWTFGGILTACLAVQIVTGIVLAMHFVPNDKMAFDFAYTHIFGIGDDKIDRTEGGVRFHGALVGTIAIAIAIAM